MWIIQLFESFKAGAATHCDVEHIIRGNIYCDQGMLTPVFFWSLVSSCARALTCSVANIGEPAPLLSATAIMHLCQPHVTWSLDYCPSQLLQWVCNILRGPKAETVMSCIQMCLVSSALCSYAMFVTIAVAAVYPS